MQGIGKEAKWKRSDSSSMEHKQDPPVLHNRVQLIPGKLHLCKSFNSLHKNSRIEGEKIESGKKALGG